MTKLVNEYSIILVNEFKSMIEHTKGGRGKKAPYESTHVRVPLPIKQEVETLIEKFKNGEVTNDGKIIDSDFYEVEKAIDLARRILSSKKSAKVSLQKLLTGIYDIDIDL